MPVLKYLLNYFQDEIKAYQDTEQLLKLRSKLYKRCGVVLNDVGQVAMDKAVQAEDIGNFLFILNLKNMVDHW